MVFNDFYRDKRVLVTGHTGFKGSWLCEWLLALGAHVSGLALDPDENQPLFDQLGLGSRLEADHRCDVRDAERVRSVVAESSPQLLFHLAAQPLVRLSYDAPVETFSTNVLGTVHVLDAVRQLDKACTIVIVTTDKCYENREWLYGYREDDPLGGHDVYSASKACAELVAASFRSSFFASGGSLVRLATARAGNVIGGGDAARDRIVPDAIRALDQGQPVPVRNKTSTRPWQHVLEPLSGYLHLGASIHSASINSQLATLNSLCAAFNFGPNLASNRTVADLVEEILKHWPGTWQDCCLTGALHEAGRLNLATDKAFHLLGWQPVWTFEETVARTVAWYRQHSVDFTTAGEFTRAQIADYTAAAQSVGLRWTGFPFPGS